MSEPRLHLVSNADLVPATPHAMPTGAGLRELFRSEAFWTGIAAARAELRLEYRDDYTDEQKAIDAERQSELERIERRARTRLPLTGSPDFEAWFWRWRKLPGEGRAP